MNDDPAPDVIRLGDAYAFIDDGVIMIKSADLHGDPVELTESQAVRLAEWLSVWARHLGDE